MISSWPNLAKSIESHFPDVVVALSSTAKARECSTQLKVTEMDFTLEYGSSF